jgi:Ca2+-binding RTX toxin-like protein
MNYQFNGIDDGASVGNFVFGGPNPDLVNITYTEGYFTYNIRNDGPNVVIESSLGGTFTLYGVVLDQLTDANFSMNDEGDVRIGTGDTDFLAGNIVVGLGGIDFITGGQFESNDYLAGNAGNDFINGFFGMDNIRGGQGDDVIFNIGTGSTVYGDRNADWIDASNAFNTDLEDTTGVNIFGGNGNPDDKDDGGDTIFGSNYNDVIQGNGGEDDIDGNAGDDIIRGGKANDEIDGDTGKDWIRGDKGEDIIDGGWGADELEGGKGDDIFAFYAGGGNATWMPNLTEANLDAEVLGTLPNLLGSSQLDEHLDKITDLNAGDDGFHGVDQLFFQGWDSTGGNAGEVRYVEDINANSMLDLQTAYYTAVGGDDDDQAVVIEVTSGNLAGKEFLFVSTNADGGLQDPEYALQITGYDGTIDATDIIGILPP